MPNHHIPVAPPPLCPLPVPVTGGQWGPGPPELAGSPAPAYPPTPGGLGGPGLTIQVHRAPLWGPSRSHQPGHPVWPLALRGGRECGAGRTCLPLGERQGEAGTARPVWRGSEQRQASAEAVGRGSGQRQGEGGAVRLTVAYPQKSTQSGLWDTKAPHCT